MSEESSNGMQGMGGVDVVDGEDAGTVGVSVKMPAELRDRLLSEAAREKRTLSGLVRYILSRELDGMLQRERIPHPVGTRRPQG